MAWNRRFASGSALAVCLLVGGCGTPQAPPADAESTNDSAARSDALIAPLPAENQRPAERQRPAENIAGSAAAADPSSAPQRLPVGRLPNAIRLTDKVICGGSPEGDAGFAELVQLGVKTLISVDGARPDVALAKRHGLRYVHLPHGYDGVPEQKAKELAKAVRDLDGVVYIHCHHGKHRSPAAAVVACVGAGLLPAGRGADLLKFAGTSENYQGLYESASDARRLEDRLLDELQADFPETAELPPLAKAMVDVEHTHDRLQQIAAAGWKTPQRHPDLDPPHEALLLREHFTELLRAEQFPQQPDRFRGLLVASETASGELEAALRQWQTAGTASQAPPEADAAFERVTRTCKQCHDTFRDIPLSKKPR